MCNGSCVEFGLRVTRPEDVRDRRVLEVGAYDVNGSLRPGLTAMGRAKYVGIDIEPGPGVDEVCDANDIVSRYGEAAWDIVVCTEVLEHVWDWRSVVSNLKRSLAIGGKLVVTTRSIGFPYHAFPFDFWRFEVADARVIFGDMAHVCIETDPEMAGIFVAAERAEDFVEADLRDHFVYSMLTGGMASDPEEALLKSHIARLAAEGRQIRANEQAHRNLLHTLRRGDDAD